ncbi:MAG: tetratricopeptide repeat protein [Crocosphaera sp.]
MYLQVFRISKTQIGSNNWLFRESAKLLSKFYKDQERYKELEQLSLEVLKMMGKEFKEDPLTFLTEINKLIKFYEDEEQYDRKKYKALEKLYLESLELNQEEIDKNPDTFLNRVDDLAQSYTQQKRYEKAKKLYLKVLEMYKEKLGEDSPYIKRILFKMEVIETYIDT